MNGRLLVGICVTTLLASSGCADAAGSSAYPRCGGKSVLVAEGSTTQVDAMQTFNAAWKDVCPDNALKYIPTGSGDGRTKFIANESDFAGSDSPLTSDQTAQATERCGGHPAWHLPMVFSPIVVAYSLDGVSDLVVSGPVLAKIFNGVITNWDDPAIAALNGGVALPDVPVVPVFRSDPTGLTNDFEKYLTAVAPTTWTQGTGSDFRGGAGIGAEGPAGVVATLQSVQGAIAYLEQTPDELVPAEQAQLRSARIDTGGEDDLGEVVALSEQSVTATVDNVEFQGSDDDLALNTDSLFLTRAQGGYPLVRVTYEIVCSSGYDYDTTVALKSFLTTAANQGQAGLGGSGAVPLSRWLQQRLLESIEQMH